MLALKFTMHRFSCSATTLASLFEPDSRGRFIPETSSFECVWTRVPRAGHRGVNPLHIKQEGTTTKSYFKPSGSDMVLDFSQDSTVLYVSDSDVVMFQLRPLEYQLGGIPVLAKGTLNPVLYMDKPGKNYLISMRDASDQVLGTLSIFLKVEIDKGSNEINSLITHHYDYQHLPQLLDGNSSAVVNPDLSHLNKLPYDASIDSSRCQLMEKSDEGKMEQQGLELTLEYVRLDPDSANNGNASPFLQRAEYYLKVQYSTIAYTTTPVLCGTHSEINFLRQTVYLMSLYRDSEKLRFSLWENNRQISGFSIDLTKLRVEADRPTEYTVPFRYHPTQQTVVLGFSVRKVVGVGAKALRGSQTLSRPAPSFVIPLPDFLKFQGRDASHSSSSSVLKRAAGSSASNRPSCEPLSQEVNNANGMSSSVHLTSPNQRSWGTLKSKNVNRNGTFSQVRKIGTSSGNPPNIHVSPAPAPDAGNVKGCTPEGRRSPAVDAKGSSSLPKRVYHSMTSADSSNLSFMERSRVHPGVWSAGAPLSIDIENSTGRFPKELRKGTPPLYDLAGNGVVGTATSELEAFLYEVVNRIEQRRARAEKRFSTSLSDDWRVWNEEMAGRSGGVKRLPSPSTNRGGHSRAGSVRSRASSRTPMSQMQTSSGNRPVQIQYEQDHYTSSNHSHTRSGDRLSSIW
ncbi:unnamed protein product [Phytomonas sp. Hart1]|nr:unnamed protein product [Phytomonas sp. Hart1]|eukprot:CCW70016.1 unnamed protein product [Phytomonas sp. isolate Hart1]